MHIVIVGIADVTPQVQRCIALIQVLSRVGTGFGCIKKGCMPSWPRVYTCLPWGRLSGCGLGILHGVVAIIIIVVIIIVIIATLLALALEDDSLLLDHLDNLTR